MIFHFFVSSGIEICILLLIGGECRILKDKKEKVRQERKKAKRTRHDDEKSKDRDTHSHCHILVVILTFRSFVSVDCKIDKYVL